MAGSLLQEIYLRSKSSPVFWRLYSEACDVLGTVNSGTFSGYELWSMRCLDYMKERLDNELP